MKIIDAHCHAYLFDKNYLKELKDFIIIGVSDDIESIKATVELSREFDFIIPSIGYHPWKLKSKLKEDEKRFIYDLINRTDIKVLGEIGLDKKFVPETYDKQLEALNFFINLSKEFDLSLNLHAPDAWREVLNILIKNDIGKAYFHWYTGPIELIDIIKEYGYFIGINPALKIQEKHRKVLEYVDLRYILLESDGPYNYRNIYLEPKILLNTLEEISRIKGVSKEYLLNIFEKNFKRFISK